MKKLYIHGAILSVIIASTSANAALVSRDWQAPGDNLITLDTATGLEWLDLTVTRGLTPNIVTVNMRTGQEYEGWRFASITEVSGLWDAAGGDNTFYDGSSVNNNNVFDTLSSFVGDLLCEEIGCQTGEGATLFITGSFDIDDRILSLANDDIRLSQSIDQDFLRLNHALFITDQQSFNAAGSALVRVTSVPLPSALLVFCSGIIGLLGVAGRLKTTKANAS